MFTTKLYIFKKREEKDFILTATAETIWGAWQELGRQIGHSLVVQYVKKDGLYLSTITKGINHSALIDFYFQINKEKVTTP